MEVVSSFGPFWSDFFGGGHGGVGIPSNPAVEFGMFEGSFPIFHQSQLLGTCSSQTLKSFGFVVVSHTLDGSEILLIGSLSHYFQGFIHPRWCRISSINSISTRNKTLKV